jgi:hypothetical protein
MGKQADGYQHGTSAQQQTQNSVFASRFHNHILFNKQILIAIGQRVNSNPVLGQFIKGRVLP